MDKRTYYEIRPIYKNEWEDAMQLAWDTFLVFEAPDYSVKGVYNFKSFVRDPLLKKMFTYGEYIAIGAFLDNRMVGILGLISDRRLRTDKPPSSTGALT